MTGRLNLDDRPGEAEAAWRLGKALCVGCGMYHQIMGALWAAGVFNGARRDFAAFPDLWGKTLQPGGRVLIAGCGDLGQIWAVRDLAKAYPLTVTVMDLCPAPLALIDELEPLQGITLKTRAGDLMALDETDAYDLILSHKMLPFVAVQDRLRLLRGLRAALAPGGRLLITVPVGSPAEDAYEAGRKLRVREKLLASPVAMAVIGDALEAVLTAYIADVSRRTGAFSGAGEVRGLLQQAGLAVEQHLEGSRTASSASSGPGRRNHTFLAARA